MGWIVGLPTLTLGQPIPDATLPTNSTVTALPGGFEIGGGTQAGRNLFHSFEAFSVNAGETVQFQLGATTETIFSRVTGAGASQIDGRIEVPGSTNLFLLNPNGVSFGETAQLNLGGSFVGSTAQGIQFLDGTEFGVAPAGSSLLSIETPIGLRFNSSPAPIQVTGSGSNLQLDIASSEIIDTARPAGLEVVAGETLALIGGPITLAGGNLTAPAGRVVLSGIEGDSVVGVNPDTLGFSFEHSQVSDFSDVFLTDAASVDTSSLAGGAIQVQGRQIVLLDGSTLLSNTSGSGLGQSVSLDASQVIGLVGISADPVSGQPFFPSSVLAEITTGASGEGGPISIKTPELQLVGGGQISTSTRGPGSSGDLTVDAGTINLVGASPFSPSAIASIVGFPATGEGGDISVTAERISATGSGSIVSFAFGPGRSGTTQINTQSLELSGGSSAGPSGILASSVLGTGGRLEIQADTISISGGAQLQASTFGPGSSGQIDLQARDIELVGTSPSGNSNSGIFTSAEAGSLGDAGNVNITSQNLTIKDGGRIVVSTASSGKGGTLSLDAEDVRLSGTSAQGRVSGLLSTVDPSGTGQGGDLLLNIDRLEVNDGAQVLAATAGAGDAGTLRLNADTVELSGQSDFSRSGLLASAIIGAGAGGNVEVVARDLTVRDGAIINAGNLSTVGDLPPGQGPAGNIILTVEQLNLADEGSLSTASAGGQDGNIQISSEFLTLRRGASITANALGAATGGNIEISSDFIVAFSDENSDITANAQNNLGGNILIRANNLFGIEPRIAQTSSSDITASSALGLESAGTITINRLEADPGQKLTELPSQFNQSDQIATACSAETAIAATRLIVNGHQGLPRAVNQPFAGQYLWRDQRLPLSDQSPDTGPEIASAALPQAPPIQEASRWSKQTTGEIQLVADGRLADTATTNCRQHVNTPGSS